MIKNDNNKDYAELLNQFVQNRTIQLRDQKQISAREMSLQLGQSENYINKIENRKSLPSMTMFHYICEFFEITPAEFYSEEVENPILCHKINAFLRQMSNEQLLAILSVAEQFLKAEE